LLRFIRLQGKQVAESVYDPVLNVIFVAWDVLVPKFAAEEWENFREERFRTDPSFNHRQCWREIVARPSNAAEAREVLDTIIADHVENLKELLARNEAIEAVADPDWADRAALDLSPGFERLRRYQSAKTRELQRTLDALRKLRHADFGIGNGEKADGKCQMADDECQVVPGELQVAPGELKSPIQTQGSYCVSGGQLARITLNSCVTDTCGGISSAPATSLSACCGINCGEFQFVTP